MRNFFKKFHFPKHKKSFFLRKFKKFVNLRAKMFHFPKYKKNFVLRNFFRKDFFF